jgi:uncharacterized protein YndB with AHSA1/START domain
MSTASAVVLHREFPVPVGTVWAALTESDRLVDWIGTYTGRGRPGGTVEFTMTGEVDAGGEVAPPTTVTIIECDPPRHLVVDIPGPGDAPWRIAVTLQDDADTTFLRFEQPATEGVETADIAAGWSWYLDRLGAALLGGPMPEWAEYAPGS